MKIPRLTLQSGDGGKLVQTLLEEFWIGGISGKAMIRMVEMNGTSRWDCHQALIQSTGADSIRDFRYLLKGLWISPAYLQLLPMP
jgi:hypothetical protein